MSEQYNARTALVVATCAFQRQLLTLEGQGHKDISVAAVWQLLNPVLTASAQLQGEETRIAA